MAIDKDAALKRAEKCLRQGKLDGAIAEYVRLVEEAPRDWALINALGDLYVRAGNVERAVEQFTRVADFLFDEGFLPKAQAVYKKALKVDSIHQHTLTRLAEIAIRQGMTADARQYLAQVRDQERIAGLIDDPVLLLSIAAKELAAGKDAGLQRVTRAITQAPERAGEVVRTAVELAGQPAQLDRAFACLDIVVDAALLEGELKRASSYLNEFVQTVPKIPALTKLLEICVDADLDWLMRETQGRLAEAYRAAGRDAEAQAILEDLDIGLAAAERPEEVVDEEFFADLNAPLPSPPPVVEPEPVLTPEAESTPARASAPEPQPCEVTPLKLMAAAESSSSRGGEIVLETLEIDLSQVLAELEGGTPPGLTAAPPDIETVFEQMRAQAGQASAGDQLEAALRHLHEGREDEAIAMLQEAARVPTLRFRASAQLGGLHLRRGDLMKGIEWMERAAQAPAPTPEDGHTDRKSTRLNSSHVSESRMPSSA